MIYFNLLYPEAASRKGTSSGMWSSGAAQKKPGSRSRNVPWRAAARAGRQRWGSINEWINVTLILCYLID